MKARSILRFNGAVITATRIDLATTDASAAPAIAVAEVSLAAFDQTPEYTTRGPVLLPAGKTKRTWRWSLLGANLWQVTAGDEVLYVQTTPAGVVRLDENEVLTILRDGFARELGYANYQTWQDETAAYQLAREAANREARDDALRKATGYVLDLKLPELLGSTSEQMMAKGAREGILRFAKAAVLYKAIALQVASKRGTKINDAKAVLKAIERCKDAGWFVNNRNALVKPGARVDLDRVLSKLATLQVPAK